MSFTLTIHYRRELSDYDGWYMIVRDGTRSCSIEKRSDSRFTSFGAVFRMEISSLRIGSNLYLQPCFSPREVVDGEERQVNLKALSDVDSEVNIFIVQGELKVHSNPATFRCSNRARFLFVLISMQPRSVCVDSNGEVENIVSTEPWIVAYDQASSELEVFSATYSLRRQLENGTRFVYVIDSAHLHGDQIALTVCSDRKHLTMAPTNPSFLWTPSDGTNFAELCDIGDSFSAAFYDGSIEALKLLRRESQFIPGVSNAHWESIVKTELEPETAVDFKDVPERYNNAMQDFLDARRKSVKLYFRKLDRSTPFYMLKVKSIADENVVWNVHRHKNLYRGSSLFDIGLPSGLTDNYLQNGITITPVHVDTKKPGMAPVVWKPDIGYSVVLAESYEGLMSSVKFDVSVNYYRFDEPLDWKKWELRIWTKSDQHVVKAMALLQNGAILFDLAEIMFKNGSEVSVQPVKTEKYPSEWCTGDDGEQYQTEEKVTVVCRDVVRTWTIGELKSSTVHILQGIRNCLATTPDIQSFIEHRFVRIRYMRYSVGGYDGWKLWTWEDHEDSTSVCEIAPEKTSVSADWVDFVVDRAKYGTGLKIGLVPRLGADAWEERDDPERFWNKSMLAEKSSSRSSGACDDIETFSIVQGTDVIFKDVSMAKSMLSAEVNAKGEIIIRCPVPFAWIAPAESKSDELDVRVELMSQKVRIDSKMMWKVKKRFEVSQIEHISPVLARIVLASKDLLDEDFLVERTRVLVHGFDTKYLKWLVHKNPDMYCYSGQLGAVYSPKQTVFRCFAPTASKVSVVLYDEPQGNRGRVVVPMRRIPEGCWKVVVREFLKGRFYKLLAEGENMILFPGVEVIDPYSRCNTSHSGRGLIFGYEKTPIAPRPDVAVEETIVYELHIRDATIDECAGAKNRGKYLGLTERGTRLQVGLAENSDSAQASVADNQGDDGNTANIANILDKYSTCLDHIIQMGVTAVQIMPVQDFDNDELDDSAYRWGYMPVHFNSPDGWYASSVTTVARITELKCLIDAFHKAGIKVIMDVVYNHTAEDSNEMNLDARFSFNGLAPRYYYRTCGNTPKAHTGDRTCGLTMEGRDTCGTCYSNGSGCGNEFRSESPMGRKFIIDSLVYWAREYQVDGFRFDLLGLIDLDTISEATHVLHTIDPNIVVYGEPWCGGLTPVKVTDKGSQRSRGFSVFNNSFRDAIRGSPFGAEETFLMDGGRIDEVKRGIIGSIDEFCDSPMESVNYVECHDNYTLWDHMQFYIKSRTDDIVFTDEDLRRMHALTAVIVLTAQGIPFIQIGQEMCRSKFGVENSYESSDNINKVRWEKKLSEWKTVQYYAGLIHLRKMHPEIFAIGNADSIRSRITFYEDIALDVPLRCIAFHIEGNPKQLYEKLREASDSGNEEDLREEAAQWSSLVVLLNPTPQEVNFPLPDHQTDSVWIQLVNDKYAGVDQICGPIVGGVSVPGRSGSILRRASNLECDKFRVYLRLACVSDVFTVPGGDDGLTDYSVSLAKSRSPEEHQTHLELAARRKRFMDGVVEEI